MEQKNYEVLGRKWVYYISFPELLIDLQESDAKLQSIPSSRNRRSRILDRMMYPSLRHLGFGPIPDDLVQRQVNQGVDLTVEYFTTAWWQPSELTRFNLNENEIKILTEENTRALDKNRPDPKLRWYAEFRSALFLSGLASRWDDLAKICSWFDATIAPEYQAGQIEDEYQQLFICIAGSLRPEPMPGADELLAKVKKCRTKRPRLLCKAWEAADAADQAAFDKAFPETVKHFLSKPSDGQVYTWLAIDQSSVWFIAERRGLKLPPMSPEQTAAVVTRESAGMAH